jgi:hypothetical protein
MDDAMKSAIGILRGRPALAALALVSAVLSGVVLSLLNIRSGAVMMTDGLTPRYQRAILSFQNCHTRKLSCPTTDVSRVLAFLGLFARGTDDDSRSRIRIFLPKDELFLLLGQPDSQVDNRCFYHISVGNRPSVLMVVLAGDLFWDYTFGESVH